jgi:hypothetical protein
MPDEPAAPGAPLLGQGGRARNFEAVGDGFTCSSSPWSHSPQPPPCPRPVAFTTAGHVVALTHTGRTLIALREHSGDPDQYGAVC